MTQVVDDALSAGREAAARGAWREAYDLLSPAAGSLSPEDLEALAEAAYWLGKLDEAIGLREQAQAAWVEAGEPRKAALVALTVSGDYFMKGDFAVASGWFGKAGRLLDGLDESIEHGYLAVHGAMNAMMTGNIDDVIARAEDARSLAKRFESRDLEAMALVVQGRALVLKGNATQGLALLDEATAAAVSGELRPFSTGFIYCVTITSCNGLGDYRRAREWTKAAGRWCDRSDIKGFPGACRVHQATVKRLAGDWPEAEEQALQACEETQGFDAWTTAAGFYEIGEIRRRRGDFAAAEESYRMAKEWGADPQPGIAFLRLAQGKVEAASSAIKRSLASLDDPLGRIRRLPAQVEIALATGDLKTAREAASELEELTQTFRVGDEPTPAFQATTCLAWGQIRLAEGDPQGAADELDPLDFDLARDRHPVRDGRGAAAPRGRAPKARRRRRRSRGADRRESHLRASRCGPRRSACRRAPRRGAAHPYLHVHGHRRLDQARRGARRGEVGEAPGLARPDAARAADGTGRRGDQADRRRLLRRLR